MAYERQSKVPAHSSLWSSFFRCSTRVVGHSYSRLSHFTDRELLCGHFDRHNEKDPSHQRGRFIVGAGWSDHLDRERTQDGLDRNE